MCYCDDVTETSALVILGHLDTVRTVIFRDSLGVVTVVGELEPREHSHVAAGQDKRSGRSGREENGRQTSREYSLHDAYTLDFSRGADVQLE